MSIQFGVNTWTWVSPFRTEDARGLFPKVARMGFDLVEIALEDSSLVDAGEIRRLLEESWLGVTVCGAFGPSRDLASEDSAVVREALEYIRKALELSQQVGAKILCGPMYSAVGKARHIPAEERRREFDRAAEGLRQAAVMARERGVTLGVEPLNRFETDMINTAEQARRMVEAVNHPSLRIHLDTFHMNIEESSVYEAVKTAGEYLCHVHASESHRGVPGAGLAAWEQLRKGLADIHYDGAVVIETFTPEVKEIARAAAIWRPLAPSQDHLAQEGLNYLRRLFAA